MKFELKDHHVFDADDNLRMTGDGYLVANPRVARTGIQQYLGSELGRNDLATVRVFRPDTEVFKDTAMASMAYKPITDNHPPVMVDAGNWRKYSVGQAGGEVARDGEFVRVPMVMMDGSVIKKVADGKKQLSVGYTCDIDWTGGTFNGQTYDAIQKDIVVNHIAIVDHARGGDKLSIGDAAAEHGAPVNGQALIDAQAAITAGKIDDGRTTDGVSLTLVKDAYPFLKDGTVYVGSLRAVVADAATAGDHDASSCANSLLKLVDGKRSTAQQKEVSTMTDKALKTIMIDAISVETTDVGAQIIERHIKALNDSAASLQTQLTALQTKYDADIKARDTQIATLTTEKATTDAKVVTLESQIKDGAMTPAKLDALVRDRAVNVEKARSILGDKLVVDGKTESDIRKQAVQAKLGDACKDWNDDQIKASFDTLTAGVDVSKTGLNDTARAFSHGGGNTNDDKRTAAFDGYEKRLTEAWKNPGPQATQ